MNKLLTVVSAIFLLSVPTPEVSYAASNAAKKVQTQAQVQDMSQEMDMISMSQSADEFVPAPNHESFLDENELDTLRRESPVEWDIQQSGKPLSIPNFMKTALESEE